MSFRLNSAARLLVALALVTSNAAAVERSESGHGDLLLFPYYQARAETQSLLSVSLADRAGVTGVAARVVFRAPADAAGERAEPLLVDVILRAADMWVAAAAAIDAAPTVISADRSCARAARAGEILAQGPAAGAHTPWQASLPAEEGWIEVYELGEIVDPVILAELIRHDREDCDLIWSLVEAEPDHGWLAPPGNRLHGSLHLVEVDAAANYSVAPVALASFRDQPTHPRADEDHPNLADATPALARVRTADGGVRESTFAAAPVDAVSAVLMDASWEYDFTSESTLEAVTDLVVTLPTRAWYLQNGSSRAPFAAHPHMAPDGAVEMRTRVFDREGRGLGSLTGAAAPKCTPVPPNVPAGPKLDGDVNVFEFASSGLLESAHGRTLLQWDEASSASCNGNPWRVWEEVESGRHAIRFDRAPELGIGRLVSDEGHAFLGQPAIGVAFTRIHFNDFGPGGINQRYGMNQMIARRPEYAAADD